MKKTYIPRDEFPNKKRSRNWSGKYATEIQEFMESGNEAIRFSFESEYEARICYGSIFGLKKRHNLPVILCKSGADIYVAREGKI